MKDQSRRIQIPIYDVEIEVVATDALNKAVSYPPRVKRIGKYDPPGDDTLAVALKEGPYFAIVFNRKGVSHGLIAHEALHTTAGILQRAGIRIKDGNEPYAYLIGFIVKLVTNQLRKFKVKIE